MFLQLLETLGTFFGGLGALMAATIQLLKFLQKKDEEREAGSSSDDSVPWMIPAEPLTHLAAAA